MRVVEYRPDTSPVSYRVLWGLAVIAGIFSLIVAAFMVANVAGLRSSDPIHAPALQTLMEQLKANPQDAALKEQIRELDLLARRAFFSSQRFNAVATWLLLGGLVLSFLSFKSLAAYHERVPYPDSSQPREKLEENARWARRSIVCAALVLVGLALSLALPWRTRLESVSAPAASVPIAAQKSGETTAPAATQASPAPPVRTESQAASSGDYLNHWPGFRGPRGGLVPSQGIATQWDARKGEGLVWKTAVELPGFGSPVVWGDRVFLTGGNASTRAVFCYDAAKGSLLWRKDLASQGIKAPKVSDDTGYAAPTMAVDAAHAYAIFATGELAAFTLDGTQVWSRNLGLPENPYGHGSSLLVHEGLLFIQMDRNKESFVAALDGKTGKDVWKTPRKFGPSWASPALVEIDGKPLLILSALPSVVAYDPRSGAELWRVDCFKGGEVVGTPVYENGVLYLTSDASAISAVDVKARKLLWQVTEEVPGVSTPVVHAGVLVGGLGEGGLVAMDAMTGKKLWHQDTDEAFYSSLLLVDGRVHAMERSGKMFIFPADKEGFKAFAKPELGEEVVSTPAVYGRGFIIRGLKNLYRVGS